MKKLTGLLVASTAAAVISLAAPSTAQAQVGEGRNFGLGLALGFPDVGISAQYYHRPDRSLQFVAAFWYGNSYVRGREYSGVKPVNSGVFLRADYLFHPNIITRGRVAALDWFVGPGVNFGFGNNDWIAIGVEAPIGLGVRFQQVPLDLTLEVIPRLNLVDSGSGFGLGFGVAGAFHIRYYF